MAQGDTPVYKYLIMYVIIGVLFYLAVVKKFEPLLLLPIAFGMLLANLPGAELFHMDFFLEEHPDYGMILQQGGLLDLLYIGVKLGIYPSLIFMGVGAMTDFTPLIADPKSLLLGAAAQFGVFAAFYRCTCNRIYFSGRRGYRYYRRSGRPYRGGLFRKGDCL